MGGTHGLGRVAGAWPRTRWCIASLARNSRTLERSTLRPSAVREKGVRPAPFSCTSQRTPAEFTTCGVSTRGCS